MKNNIFLTIAVTTFLPIMSYAQELQIDYLDVGKESEVFKKGRLPMLPEYIQYLLKMSIYLISFMCFIIMVWAGWDYFTSQGSSKTLDAKDRIKAAFTGLIILLCSWLILDLISPDFTTMNMGLKTVGVVLQNAGEENLLVSSGAPNFERNGIENGDPSDDFIPVKIRISKEYKNTIEITLYSERNFSGSTYRMKPSDWTCGKNECESIYPAGYRSGSITILILRPGVFVYKDGKVPYYAGSDLNDTFYIRDFLNIEGEVDSIRIYNSSSTRWGAITYTGTGYGGVGVLYIPPKKEGWATGDIVNLDKIFSVRVFNAKELKPDYAKYYHNPEYDYEAVCSFAPEIIGSGIQAQKLSCGFKNYLYSLKLTHAWAILLSEGNMNNPNRFNEYIRYRNAMSSRLPQGSKVFAFAELIKASDPNMDDNPEIGQCVCNGRWMGFLWCVNWQSCATHAVILKK